MKVLMLLSLLVFSLSVFAQHNYVVSGRVVDESGKPIPAVNIVLSESQRGTVSNDNGEFSLRVKAGHDILKALYMGYETYSVKVDPTITSLNIILKSSSIQLNEVVVTNLSAKELMERAVGEISKNYAMTPFLTKAYYRAKVTEEDTLLYVEETAFDIVKSYSKNFDDKYFLVKNRNIMPAGKEIKLRGVGSYDIVKSASYLLDKSFLKDKKIEYLPSTNFDDRIVYVISVSSLSEKEKNKMIIYIDMDDLAFVRFELQSKSGDEVTAQYKKIDSKYYLMDGHSINVNKRSGNRLLPAESSLITTDIIPSFSKDDIAGASVNVSDVLRVYETHDKDSVFWNEHNALFPDSAISFAMSEYALELKKGELPIPDSLKYVHHINRLYTPNISLIGSSDLTKDFYSLNYNITSVNRYVNHLFSKKIRSSIFKLAANYAYNYFISMPIEEILSERQLLYTGGLKPDILPTFINKYRDPYLYGVNNDILSEFKENNYYDFMRLHTVRNDGHYTKAILMEEELAKADLSNINNRVDAINLYSPELLLHRIRNMYNPFAKKVRTPENISENKRPLLVDRGRSWVKYMFEPDALFQRHVTQSDLTSEERKYLKRSSWLSWMNIVSPQMIGIGKFKLNDRNSFTFSLDYLRAPYGEMFGQNIWLVHNYNQLHGIFLKQYKNYEQTTLGVGYKLYDLKLFRNFRVTSSLDLWQQPKDLIFKDSSKRAGLHVGQMYEYSFLPHKYNNTNKLSLFVGYDYKTEGYYPQSYYLGENFDIKAGFRVYLK